MNKPYVILSQLHMQKMLFVDAEKCTGCRLCETVCSIRHENVCNPSRARVHVVKWEMSGFYVPIVCQQCEAPVCESICPVDAIGRDSKTGAMMINYDKCIGCKMCVVACPLGGTGFDMSKRRVIKCDLCEGEPQCARYCDPGAIQYLDATTQNIRKKRAAAERFPELMKKLTEKS